MQHPAPSPAAYVIDDEQALYARIPLSPDTRNRYLLAYAMQCGEAPHLLSSLLQLLDLLRHIYAILLCYFPDLQCRRTLVKLHER